MAQKRRARTAKAAPSRPPRWMVLGIGLALFVGAVWVLTAADGEPPLGEIGPDSRAQLERVLEREDPGTRP